MSSRGRMTKAQAEEIAARMTEAVELLSSDGAVNDDLRGKLRALEAERDKIETSRAEFERRATGMSRMLAEIRVKADAATGVDLFAERIREEGSDISALDARSLSGRAVGATGAVDCLIVYAASLHAQLDAAKEQIAELEDKLRLDPGDGDMRHPKKGGGK